MTADDTAKACARAMWANDEASKALGIEVVVEVAGRATATLEVTAAMLNGFSVCHGGFLFALADTAFAFACNSYDRVTLAAGADVEFLRPGELGDRLTATATERSRGRRRGLYDATVVNQRGEEVAVFRGRSHATSRSILAG